MHIRIIAKHKYHYPSLGLVIKVKTTKGEWVEKKFWDSSTLRHKPKVKSTTGEWVEKMFWDSSTLPQVWESESQHSQVVFSLWKLKSFEVPNLQNKSASRKWCSNWLQCFIGKVLKYTYQKQTHILQLQLWIRNYDPQKKLMVKLTT